jgi:hypothetical protein
MVSQKPKAFVLGFCYVLLQRHLGRHGEAAMTTQNEEEVQAPNEVDDAQKKLDEEQGGNAAPQYVTKEDLANFERVMTAQIGGLQGKIDTGLNGIRRDGEAATAKQVAEARQQTFNQLLQDVPYESQAAFKVLWEQQAATQVTTQQPVAGALTDQERVQAQNIARNFGVDPSDARIDYAALVDSTLTPDQAQQKFFTSLKTVGGPAVANVPAPAGKKTDNPPVESPAGTGNGLNNIDAVRDAFIEGRLPLADYKTRMAALGQPVN